MKLSKKQQEAVELMKKRKDGHLFLLMDYPNKSRMYLDDMQEKYVTAKTVYALKMRRLIKEVKREDWRDEKGLRHSNIYYKLCIKED